MRKCVTYFGITIHRKKMWYIYTMEYDSAIKKNEVNIICSNMDGPRDYHIKWSKSDRQREILYDITSMWNLKKWYELTYLQNRNRLSLRKQTYGYQRWKMGGWDG